MQNDLTTKEKSTPKRILFGIACVVILSFIAIAAGLVINDDGTDPKATEVFASWIDFFTGNDDQTEEGAKDNGEGEANGAEDASGGETKDGENSGEGEAEGTEDASSGENEADGADGNAANADDLPEFSANPRNNVRSSYLVYEPEDQSYVIRKSFYGSNLFREKEGLVCVYTDEAGEHTEWLVEDAVTQFSVMNGILYYTAWDEDAVGWTLYQRELFGKAEIRECLPEEYRGRMSFQFSCYEGKIYYASLTEEIGLFCYDPESQSNSRVDGIALDTYRYDIWEHTFFNLDFEGQTLWIKEPEERASKRVYLPGIEGELLWDVRIWQYQGRDYLAVIEGACENGGGMSGGGMLVNPRLCVYALGEEESKPVIALNLWSLDFLKDWQYRDGCFYVPSTDAYSVQIFELGEYLTGENDSGIYPGGEEECQIEGRKLFVSDERMAAFEVTERFLYAYLNEEQNLIRVYDRMTGELIEEINGSEE